MSVFNFPITGNNLPLAPLTELNWGGKNSPLACEVFPKKSLFKTETDALESTNALVLRPHICMGTVFLVLVGAIKLIARTLVLYVCPSLEFLLKTGVHPYCE